MNDNKLFEMYKDNLFNNKLLLNIEKKKCFFFFIK